MPSLKSLTHRLLSLVAPRTCLVCGCALTRAEQYLCLACMLDMPRTGVHRHDGNRLTERLSRRTALARVAAWFTYSHRDPYSRIVRMAKYNDMPRLACWAGRTFAAELAADGFFDSDAIDLIVPTPLSRWRLMSRGYNQTMKIAQGIAQTTGIAVCSDAVVAHRHISQTTLDRRQRAANVLDGVFTVHRPDLIDGRNVLVVDDVITTGATIDALVSAITTQAAPASVSVLTLGMTAAVR